MAVLGLWKIEKAGQENVRDSWYRINEKRVHWRCDTKQSPSRLNCRCKSDVTAIIPSRKGGGILINESIAASRMVGERLGALSMPTRLFVVEMSSEAGRWRSAKNHCTQSLEMTAYSQNPISAKLRCELRTARPHV